METTDNTDDMSPLEKIINKSHEAQIKEAEELINKSRETQAQEAEAADELSKRLTEHNAVTISEICAEVVFDIEEHLERENPSCITGISTGFADLDRMTSGLHGGDMIVVAGRPSIGKTAFALNIAEHVGVDLHQPVAIFSLGMSRSQIATRLLSSIGRINQQRIRSGALRDEEWERLMVALGKLHNAPIVIAKDTLALTAMRIWDQATGIRDTYGSLGLVVVDSIQGLDLTNTDRTEGVGDACRILKKLAQDLNVPVIATSGATRAVEARHDRRPLLHDLRDSGEIEDIADIVVMLYREDFYRPDTPERGIAEAILAKQRNGPTGLTKLAFLSEYIRFESLHTGAN